MAGKIADDFATKLDVGIRVEDSVYQLLISRHQYVQDCRYQRRERNMGPRLCGRNGRLIMPDFVVYDDDVAMAVDVKFKTSIYPIGGVLCFTVDYSKLLDYLEAARVMRLDGVWLMFVYNGGTYRYTATQMHGRHSFNNKYGNDAALFAYHEKYRIQ